jgi:DNA-binding transcriptional MerR regulator
MDLSGAESRRGLYSIGAVSRMLGLASATIRNWEERYGIVKPERSEGGHRLYSRDDVERLRFVAARLEEGMHAAEAHRLLAERLDQGRSVGEELEVEAPRLLILLAERDPLAAELSEFFLRTEGYEVECVLDASEAGLMFDQLAPQLVIVELLISGGSGTDLCRRFKQDGAAAVIAVSTLDSREQALQAGADAFLQKPVDPLQLVSTVKDLFGASRLVATGNRIAVA